MNKDLTPKAIVAALDTHIIGQKDAKRAVAVSSSPPICAMRSVPRIS